MKVTLTNTTKIIDLDGIPVRVWEGETESGIKIHALITRIAVNKDDDCSEFEKELEEAAAPSVDVEMYPSKLIL